VSVQFFTAAAVGQELASDKRTGTDSPQPSTTTTIAALAAVEALVNRNHVPDLVGDHTTPIFDDKFDWAENGRVWKAISRLVENENAEVAWTELVAHLDDEHYCITLKNIEGFTCNWTVGDICQDIVGGTLAAAYYRHMRPLKAIVWIRFALPDVATDKKKLKAWCREQSKRKLYELQADMCEWAETELKQRPRELRGVSSETIRDWIRAIAAERESLRGQKQAVFYGGFRGESQHPYTREMAERIQKELQEAKKSEK
jgi:hypothetical protein